MRYQNFYQFSLIFFAFLVVLGVGIFLYHELFPQYKTYQHAYIDLEQFRASYTGEKPAPFSTGIKQILIPDENQGPEIIDRCISCHVATDLPHFSSTRVARNVNNQVIIDSEGLPVLEPNPDYVWGKLEEEVETLRNPLVIDHLRAQGRDAEANQRLTAAEELAVLKTRVIDGKKVDLAKVIAAHPLLGAETRPFEFHPMEEYGCTSCHSGNGRALVAKRAHGPVFDGEYEKAYDFPKPQFTEEDPENDPRFAQMFNHKPGHELIFQTTPILAGPLIQAKCVQCHQSTSTEIKTTIDQFNLFLDQKREQIEMIREGVKNDQEALKALRVLERSIEERGREGTIAWLNTQLGDYHLTSDQIDNYEGQLTYIKEHEEAAIAIHEDIERIHATQAQKRESLKSAEGVLMRFERTKEPLQEVVQDSSLIKKLGTRIDRLIGNYTRGKELFISQACYACHRIAGFSRSSVGPELTKAGLSYPWFIKESIVWPQADLPSSTMPNFHLDHEELADLMTFLMAQKGQTKTVSEVDYAISLKEWEAGEKMPWEKPVSPLDIQNVRAGMLVFASQGCASCHKLEGFDSNVGFAIEKNSDATLIQLIDDRNWFRNLFPEQILGSRLSKVVETHAEEIDRRIVNHVHDDGIIEEIEKKFPDLVEGFYTNFKFASRAKNHEFRNEPERLVAYKERLHRVLMMYIQEYGLGRDIAPHLNWSGVYRDEAWLLGHFRSPAAYTAKSIMPIMPFDDTKFFMLNHMLQVLGRKNREKLQEIWTVEGFNPPLAFTMLCSSCHGEQRQGHGIISEWIYPIPKNLRNPVFLRNLTRERAIDSITHGVSGTPMPPWGESASPSMPPVLSHTEISQLVDWLYQGLPPSRRDSKEDFEKWRYSPKDVVEEMKKSDDFLKPEPSKKDNVDELVAAYFEMRHNPIPSPDKELYYIREKYYTAQNLDEAEQFYQVNCATCHGKEGTGTGLRASTMVEARPRMLTNLPWIRSRDDLRLLRSIKYGVPGTSMIPWGDQTTSALRMQLVMFIRELTRSQIFREDLEALLYDRFDEPIQIIEKARVNEYTELEAIEKRLRQREEELFNLTSGQLRGTSEEIGTLYKENMMLKDEIVKRQKIDDHYQQLMTLLREEQKIYHALGMQLIAAKTPPLFVEHYFEIIHNIPLIYSLKDGSLQLNHVEAKKEEAKKFFELLLRELEAKISEYQKKINLQESKIDSPEAGKRVETLMAEQGTYINLKTKLVVQLADAKKLRHKQKQIYDDFL